MELVAVFGLLIASVIFAFQVKVPIVYLFTSTINMASSLYMFNLHGTGSASAEGPTYLMFGFIFIASALWMLMEALREFIR
jgi:hypothetical protein